jgi:predicted glycosyltransferase
MKIWIDACEPKTVIMLKPLYYKLNEQHDIYITSRDFDSTFYLLEKNNLDHIKAGKHGGGSRLGKLKAYSQRLERLIAITEQENPDFLFSLASPEALRITYGLGIPNIIFNDEPRSEGVVKLTLNLADQIIVPECIPLEWYLKYIPKEEKLLRFHGIDEVGWLEHFKPQKKIIENLNLEEGKYVVCRTEATKAQYLADKMKPHETRLTQFIPELLRNYPELTFLILSRYPEQYNYLNKLFKKEIGKGRIQIFNALENLADIMYYSKLVITGGGTMVRESALLGIPSIEYFPLNTYPQEQFLIDNGFPLKHIKAKKKIINAATEYIEGDYKIDTHKKVKQLDNPVDIALREFKERME